MIETSFDVPFISDLALREKQIQQNYRPIIAVHKWFARRPGTLFRGLLLSEFVNGNLRETFFRGHNLKNLRILDPFMGGGTPLTEANRIGCDVVGYDINPMAYWIVRQEIEHLDTRKYTQSASALRIELEAEIGEFYRTTCLKCGSRGAHVKYFIWVKSHCCVECKNVFDLFPGYILSENRRHPTFVFICPACGELNEVANSRTSGSCHACGTELRSAGNAARNRAICPFCKTTNAYPTISNGPPNHRMVAIEYACPNCKPGHKGRFFKKPDADDLRRYTEASATLRNMDHSYIPDDEIPRGDETDRLHRWGYHRYREMFNPRQLLGLELSCRAISREIDDRIRNALATNLSDLLRYQNMLCRYDAIALKSLDIFSVHGFPVGLLQCESNLLGIVDGTKGTNVGSGGWSNITEKYRRAKTYCTDVFEIRHDEKRKTCVRIPGEWIGETRSKGNNREERRVELYCSSSTDLNLPPGSIDGVFTDPPYFTNVQYAELMDFCYVWLRKLAVETKGNFKKASTRDENELTGNTTMERGISHFTEGLSAAFSKAAEALKPGAVFAFTYHHNTIEAYLPVAVAVLDSGLKCSASIPCPAEMGASIHINGTGSSIVDTIFVCRSKGTVSRRTLASTAQQIAGLVRSDLARLEEGNLRATRGDIRCIVYGHLVRMALWSLKDVWDRTRSILEKINIISAAIAGLGGWDAVERCLKETIEAAPREQRWAFSEAPPIYEEIDDGISF